MGTFTWYVFRPLRPDGHADLLVVVDWKPVGAINAERQPQGGPDDAVIGVWTISPSHFLVGFQAQGFLCVTTDRPVS